MIVTPHTSWSSGRVVDRDDGALRREPAPLRRRRAAPQHGGPGRRILTPCRSRSWDLPGPARPPSSTPSRAATSRPAASAGWSSTSGSSRSRTRGSTASPRSSTRRRSSTPTSRTSISRRRQRRPRGASGTEELPAEHLGRLRDADALLHVVRTWDDPHHPHPAGSVDPWRDLEQLDLEFVLADLSMVDRRLERLRGSGRHGTPAEREANEREGGDPGANPASASRTAIRSATRGSIPTRRRRCAASAS